MSLKSILMAVLPFLYSAASKLWEKTPQDAKDAVLKAIQFGQTIKSKLDETPEQVIADISDVTKLSDEIVMASLETFGKEKKLDDTSATGVVLWLQTEAKKGLSDIAWNQHWDNLAKILAINLSSGKIDWKSVALGIIEIAFDIFKKSL